MAKNLMFLVRFLNEESGQGLVEYALMMALVFGAGMAVMPSASEGLSNPLAWRVGGAIWAVVALIVLVVRRRGEKEF